MSIGKITALGVSGRTAITVTWDDGVVAPIVSHIAASIIEPLLGVGQLRATA